MFFKDSINCLLVITLFMSLITLKPYFATCIGNSSYGWVNYDRFSTPSTLNIIFENLLDLTTPPSQSFLSLLSTKVIKLCLRYNNSYHLYVFFFVFFEQSKYTSNFKHYSKRKRDKKVKQKKFFYSV